MITEEVKVLSMCHVANQTILYTRHLLMQASKPAIPSQIEDINGYQQDGFGWMDMTIHKGVRWNTANAYLRPALRRKNLRAQTRTMITKIMFQRNRAVGVEYHLGS